MIAKSMLLRTTFPQMLGLEHPNVYKSSAKPKFLTLTTRRELLSDLR
jgi:hypothetical protein